MTDTTIEERSAELVDDYAQRLDEFVNELIPPVLDNAEFASRCSALLIALNRQLGRCAAAFGDVYQVAPDEIRSLVHGQFERAYRIAREALDGEGRRAS